MALTGLGLVGFVIAHLIGNLLVYAGPDALNAYAQKLQELGPLLWIARGGLLFIFILHVRCALKLTLINRSARPSSYSYKDTIQASYASRTMPMSGLILLAFILFHLAHFTFHYVDHDIGQYVDSLGRHDVYKMVVLGFSDPLSVLLYVIAMALLGLHLSHGLASLFQSLGINHPTINNCLRKAAPGIAWFIALANISMPVSILLGFVHLQGG
jgi:succinate dehydrogenase / fumarate reductase cytochrome b subunit